MRVFRLKDVAFDAPQAVALGYFDGGHLGHAALLEKTVSEAKAHGCEAAVFSFHSLPTKSGAPLYKEEDRLAFFERMGIANVVLADFDEVKSLSPEAFVEEILVGKLCARLALCGFNFRFGYRAAGDSELLLRLLPQSTVLPPTLYGEEPISSTRIREALSRGDLVSVQAMLGRPYAINGKVAHGRALGRTIGFPTANVSTPLFLPRYGVYKTELCVDGAVYRGLTNVGVRPTVEGAAEARTETFLPDFSGDLYEKEVRISFLSFLREERRFASLADLQEQITKDISNL